jgi:putative NIF3 family GTP cyclohydrolase 1 type 2
MTDLSRREFTALAASAVATPFALPRALPAAAAMTAQDVIDRIKANIGSDWKAETIDGVKAGDPATVVRGVATTGMATLEVLQQAVKAGANLVITGHPTFYSRTDARVPAAGRGGGRGAAAASPAGSGGQPAATPAPAPEPPPDPVFTAKNAFIAKHNLVVFRLSDHWRARTPDPHALGIASALEWMRYQSGSNPRLFDIPAVTLEALAATVKKRLRSRGGIRVVGDPRTSVRRVGLLPGSTPLQACLTLLPQVDVILAGEVREWESVEFARDKVFAGEKKGLLLVGRLVSEEPGMSTCAAWVKGFVTEVPVRHVPAGDPYWSPAL